MARKGKHLQRKRSGRASPGRHAARPSGRSPGTARIVICGGIFVLLVMARLLFPQSAGPFTRSAGELIGSDADFRSAFAAVGRAISGKEDVGQSLQEAFSSVFRPVPLPEEAPEGDLISADGSGRALSLLHRLTVPSLPPPEPQPPVTAQVVAAPLPEDDPSDPQPSCDPPEDDTTTSSLSYVYTLPPLPENASLEHRNLGFPHQSPLAGPLTSPFGWRDHPVINEERFHYGVDLGGDTGDAICAFADGTVYATGESSTLGKYIMLTHEDGYMTLYAHCSCVLVTGGSVRMGEEIALVGDTGMATGAHLHFELHHGDLYLNPIYYVEIT